MKNKLITKESNNATFQFYHYAIQEDLNRQMEVISTFGHKCSILVALDTGIIALASILGGAGIHKVLLIISLVIIIIGLLQLSRQFFQEIFGCLLEVS